jgi:transposase InsO family protein
MHLTVVSPVYKAHNIINELARRIIHSVEHITADYEIILVDDACPENSWEKIEALAKDNPKIKGIKLQFIQAGRPIQNGYIERINRSYRQDVLDANIFRKLAEVK